MTKIYITETHLIKCDGTIGIFHREEDRIHAHSWEEAESILKQRGMDMTHIIYGELICEGEVCE